MSKWTGNSGDWDAESLPFRGRESTLSEGALAIEALARAREIHLFEEIRCALEASHMVSYYWNIKEDILSWGGDASRVLKLPFHHFPLSGTEYSTFLDSQGQLERSRAFQKIPSLKEQDHQELGIPFTLHYTLRSSSEEAPGAVIEEIGQWYPDRDGNPSYAYGVLRHLSHPSLARSTETSSPSSGSGLYDPLTGLVTRHHMTYIMASMLEREKIRAGQCAFLLIAISNLHVINDAYGFDITDQVLLTLSQRLQDVIRAGDVVCRYSGSRFGVMLSKCSHDDMKIAAERFLSVARENVIETSAGYVWAMLSIGGVLIPKSADTPGLAMTHAEEALSMALQQKSYDCFVAFESSPERLSLRTLNARCASEVISSLQEDRLTLAYQPIVSAADGTIALHEGLLRMSCGEDDPIDAIHLIPISERLGLIRLVDRRVFALAVDVLTRHPQATLSLNVSGVTATDPRWHRQIIECLADHPSVARRLVIEISETITFHELDEVARFIAELHMLGCRVAIDHFGAGYTSLRTLKSLNIDFVKIDGSFCENLYDNEDNQYFVRTILDLTQRFQVKTVAEWVQRRADAELLRSWGVDYLQGHLFGRALCLEPWSDLTSDMPPLSSEHKHEPIAYQPSSSPLNDLEDFFSDTSKLNAAKACLETLHPAAQKKR